MFGKRQVVCGFVAGLTIAAAQAAETVNFGQPVATLTGDGAVAIVSGDWNNDDSVDLAVANSGAGSITILRNTGVGLFTQSQQIVTGTNSRPFALAVGDIDGDGTGDLVAAIEGTDQVAVMLHNATGGFSNPVFTLVGDSPRDVAVGDFNKAGGVDVIAANEEGDSVTVLLNTGSGGFGAATEIPLLDPTSAERSRPKGVTVGDFNKDGNLDFAAASFVQNQAVVGLGVGNGTFGTFADLKTFDTAANGDPWAIATADVNGDGNLDLLVANSLGDSVSVLLGNGDGTFDAQVAFATGNRPQDVIAADINADGKLDLVTANREGDTVSVLEGNGDGTFGAPTSFSTGTGPSGVVAGNLNIDTRVDLATANEEADNASILLATLPPTDDDGTTPPLECPGAGCGPMGLAPFALTFCGVWGLKRIGFGGRRRGA